jgi:hypothetical protein
LLSRDPVRAGETRAVSPALNIPGGTSFGSRWQWRGIRFRYALTESQTLIRVDSGSSWTAESFSLSSSGSRRYRVRSGVIRIRFSSNAMRATSRSLSRSLQTPRSTAQPASFKTDKTAKIQGWRRWSGEGRLDVDSRPSGREAGSSEKPNRSDNQERTKERRLGFTYLGFSTLFCTAAMAPAKERR